ncbi:MAG: hypothetical protein ACRCXZ_05035 [Patescibacteria group bacterium]
MLDKPKVPKTEKRKKISNRLKAGALSLVIGAASTIGITAANMQKANSVQIGAGLEAEQAKQEQVIRGVKDQISQAEANIAHLKDGGGIDERFFEGQATSLRNETLKRLNEILEQNNKDKKLNENALSLLQGHIKYLENPSADAQEMAFRSIEALESSFINITTPGSFFNGSWAELQEKYEVVKKYKDKVRSTRGQVASQETYIDKAQAEITSFQANADKMAGEQAIIQKNIKTAEDVANAGGIGLGVAGVLGAGAFLAKGKKEDGEKGEGSLQSESSRPVETELPDSEIATNTVYIDTLEEPIPTNDGTNTQPSTLSNLKSIGIQAKEAAKAKIQEVTGGKIPTIKEIKGKAIVGAALAGLGGFASGPAITNAILDGQITDAARQSDAAIERIKDAKSNNGIRQNLSQSDTKILEQKVNDFNNKKLPSGESYKDGLRKLMRNKDAEFSNIANNFPYKINPLYTFTDTMLSMFDLTDEERIILEAYREVALYDGAEPYSPGYIGDTVLQESINQDAQTAHYKKVMFDSLIAMKEKGAIAGLLFGAALGGTAGSLIGKKKE